MRRRGAFFVFSVILLLVAFSPPRSTWPHLEVHVTMRHFRDGVLLSEVHHPGVLTNVGADWIKDQLGDSPSTSPADWIAVSNDGSAPSATWDMIPGEINGTGMQRVQGTYVSVGTGQWNITHSFSPTGAVSCQLTGLYWSASPNHSLLCADTFTQVNADVGDTVEITWQLTVS